MFERVFVDHDFTAVVFDLPPTGQSGLADTAMASGRTLVIPTGYKPHDLSGLPVLATQLQSDKNEITVLGVVLNGLPVKAKAARQQAFEAISAHLAEGVGVFDAVIRNADAAMIQASRHCLTINEYATWADTMTIRQKITHKLSIPSNLGAVNEELQALTSEIRDRFLSVIG